MPDDYATLGNPLMRGIGNIADRPIPSPNDIQLPTDIEIVSSPSSLS